MRTGVDVAHTIATKFGKTALVFQDLKMVTEDRTRMQSDTFTGTVKFSTPACGEYDSIPVSIQFNIVQFYTPGSNIVSIHGDFTVRNLEVNKVVHKVVQEPEVWIRSDPRTSTTEQVINWRLGDLIKWTNSFFSGELDA